MKTSNNFLLVNCPHCNFENAVEFCFGLQLKYCDLENGGCDTQFVISSTSEEKNVAGFFTQTIRTTAHKIEGVKHSANGYFGEGSWKDFVVVQQKNREDYVGEMRIIEKNQLANERDKILAETNGKGGLAVWKEFQTFVPAEMFNCELCGTPTTVSKAFNLAFDSTNPPKRFCSAQCANTL